MARYLTEAHVGQLLDMPATIDAVAAAHLALARGEAIDVPRRRVRGVTAMQHLLQASWPARGVMGCKLYTSSAAGARFWVHLFDASDGAPLAVIEANTLGMMRTGAAGGVAARALARSDARIVGVIGAGWQARGQMRGLAAVRELEAFKVFARRADVLDTFCREMADELGVSVLPVASAEAAARGADIVLTATTSSSPVLVSDWLAPGVHVNAVGSNALVRRELDEASLLRADLVCVDARETALAESGDLLPLLDKGHLQPRNLVELGEVLAGFRRGRQDSQDVTVFESQGLAIQDLAVAALVLERAVACGQGAALPY